MASASSVYYVHSVSVSYTQFTVCQQPPTHSRPTRFMAGLPGPVPFRPGEGLPHETGGHWLAAPSFPP